MNENVHFQCFLVSNDSKPVIPLTPEFMEVRMHHITNLESKQNRFMSHGHHIHPFLESHRAIVTVK